MNTEEIRKELFRLQDEKYREFQMKLIPSAKEDNMIGVRTPDLRKLAKRIAKDADTDEFLQDLPHRYFDENQLHAFLLSGMKDFRICMEKLCRFLPYVDNWATCDQMSLKVFKSHRKELLPYIEEWIRSDHTYTVRFGLGVLLEHFLDEDFDVRFPAMAASVHSDDYYVNMMRAWYFAEALAKQYEAVLPYIEGKKLDERTHNKAIQKSIESRKISEERKNFLRSLKISKKNGGKDA